MKCTGQPHSRSTTRMALLLLLFSGLSLFPMGARAGEPRVARGMFRVLSTARDLEVDGAGMRVHLTRQPVQIEIRTSAGRLLAGGDPAAGPLTFLLDARALTRLLPAGRPVPVRDATGRIPIHLLRLLPVERQLADGMSLLATTDDPLGRTATIELRLVASGVVQVTARLADGRAVGAARMSMRSGTDEHFFGLGERFQGVDLRGHRLGMLVQDGMPFNRPNGTYAPVPFFVSSRGYGFYLAGTRPSLFALDADAPDTWYVTVEAPTLRWYLLDGPRPPDVIARYADLTGHPPMPPPWGVGVWKNLVGGQARVLAEARRLRAAHVPISVIWSYDAVDEANDFGWPWRVFQPIPSGTYPDLPAFTAALHQLGYKVLGYISPEFTRSRPSYAYAARNGYLVHSSGGTISLLDLTNPAALRWWQGCLRRILLDLGFDGWMQDLGDRMPPGARFADGRGATDLANLYPLLYAQASDAVARATKPDAIFFMRSGTAGIQQYQRAVWAGDQRATWDPAQGLAAVIPAALSWGISGAPFWGSDIGGYLDGGLPQASQEELYMRWVELGAFSPIMRDMLGMKGRNAVYLDSDARTWNTFAFYARLHQLLFPYLYAAARTAHLTGLPIMRALFLAYPNDPRVYGLNDEYLLGPDLLVAPVTTPNTTSRSAYLPAGTWVDYWTGALLKGGRSVTVAAPVERIPLFVRGGALLPLLADPGDTLAPAADPAVHRAGDALLVRIYPGGTADSTELADGTTVSYSVDARGVALRITGTVPRLYRVEVPLHHAPSGVRLGARDVPCLAARVPAAVTGWRYDPRRAVLIITVRVTGGQRGTGRTRFTGTLRIM